MDDNGGMYLRRMAALDEAELIVDRMPVKLLTQPRPFGYSPHIVDHSYSVEDFDIEVTPTTINIALNDGTSWGGFELGSDELDEFLTILNYHHQKAKGML